jgi:hypothetical protein
MLQEWQARQEGYEQIAAELKKEFEEDSPKFAKYAPERMARLGFSSVRNRLPAALFCRKKPSRMAMACSAANAAYFDCRFLHMIYVQLAVKKWVVDSNASAQEKGCEAVLMLAERCSPSLAKRCVWLMPRFRSDLCCIHVHMLHHRFAGDVTAGLVSKAVIAPRAKTKEYAMQIAYALVAVEAGDAVVEELVKGIAAKNPKAVAATVQLMADVVAEYGARVFNAKPLLQAIPKIMGHADSNVRREGTRLAVQLYRYTSADILKQHTKDLKPVQVCHVQRPAWPCLLCCGWPHRLLRQWLAILSRRAPLHWAPNVWRAGCGSREGVCQHGDRGRTPAHTPRRPSA